MAVALISISFIRDNVVGFIEHDQKGLNTFQSMYGDGLLSGISTRD